MSEQHAELVRRGDVVRYVRIRSWVYGTEADCYGVEQPADQYPRWAIWDNEEDDPPIAVCDLELDAARIVAALKLLAELTSQDLDDGCVREPSGLGDGAER